MAPPAALTPCPVRIADVTSDGRADIVLVGWDRDAGVLEVVWIRWTSY